MPPRAGNRQAGLASAPYNAFRTKDGWVAIHVVTEGHWQNLLRAMGRDDLLDDPRFSTNPARTENMEATEALVTAWTIGLGKVEVAAAAKRYKIPVAAVRNAIEVMNDPHMHERGMLQRIDHPSLGSNHRAEFAIAAAWLGSRRPATKPVARAAQCGCVWRLAGPGCRAVDELKRAGAI